MYRFSKLYKLLWTTRDMDAKAAAFLMYIQATSEEDRMTALNILSTPKQPAFVSMNKLVKWCISFKDVPEWMIKKCHAIVGDWGETLSLILGHPSYKITTDGLTEWITQLKTNDASVESMNSFVLHQWSHRSSDELFLIHKLITGTFKPVFTKSQLAHILHTAYGVDSALLHLRLNALPNAPSTFSAFIHPEWTAQEEKLKPFGFNSTEIISPDRFHFADANEWIVEAFEHGTRIQVYYSESSLTVWDENYDTIQDQKNEFLITFKGLPNQSVLEMLIPAKPNTGIKLVLLNIHRWAGLEGAALGTMEDKKRLFSSWMSESGTYQFKIPKHTLFNAWQKDQTILPSSSGWLIKLKKGKSIHYRIKPKGYEATLLLLYVEYKNQNNAIEYTITLGATNEQSELVPVSKLSGDLLADNEKMALHYWIQNNTLQRFGPVRMVRQGQYFRIEYDRVVWNKRVKSGIQLVNVTIKSWIKKETTTSTLADLTSTLHEI